MDSSKLADILAEEYVDSAERRMAGTVHRSDSGYFDIVRFFGPGAVVPEQIKVHHLSDEYQLRDMLVAAFAEEIETRMRQEGRLHEGPPSMKLASYDLSRREPHLVVQPVNYGLQAATCFALDLHHETFAAYGGTLRDYWYATRPDRSIEHNPLAVCLGVCGYLVAREGSRRYVLQVRRTAHLASLEGTLGPSAAGVVDYREDYTTLGEVLHSSLGVEVVEELNLGESEFEIVPLAWAMEIFRGDRPQLFALIETSLSRSEVAERVADIEADHREHSATEFVELTSAGAVPDKLFRQLNHEACMNVLLAEEYFTFWKAQR